MTNDKTLILKCEDLECLPKLWKEIKKNLDCAVMAIPVSVDSALSITVSNDDTAFESYLEIIKDKHNTKPTYSFNEEIDFFNKATTFEDCLNFLHENFDEEWKITTTHTYLPVLSDTYTEIFRASAFASPSMLTFKFRLLFKTEEDLNLFKLFYNK